MTQSRSFLRPAISLIAAVLLAPAAAFPVTDLVLTLDPAKAGAEFEGIVASLDGKPVADVLDSTYPRGLIGLASRFPPAQFDNLQIVSPSDQP